MPATVPVRCHCVRVSVIIMIVFTSSGAFELEASVQAAAWLVIIQITVGPLSLTRTGRLSGLALLASLRLSSMTHHHHHHDLWTPWLTQLWQVIIFNPVGIPSYLRRRNSYHRLMPVSHDSDTASVNDS